MEKKYSGLSAIAKKVTVDDLGNYLLGVKNLKNGIFCYICGSNEWDLHRNPEDREKPVIVTLPLPDKEGLGVWVFYMMCKNCGGMHFINANKIASWLESKSK